MERQTSCRKNETMRKNNIKMAGIAVIAVVAVVVVLLLTMGFAADSDDYGIALLNYNTMQTVTSFGFTDEGYARVHVDYIGYRGTEGAYITVRIEKQRLLFFWDEILIRDYTAVGESYQNEYYYPIGETGTYRCTVTYTVKGAVGEDIITFSDTKIYTGKKEPPASDTVRTEPNGGLTETTAGSSDVIVPADPVSEGLGLYTSDSGWSVLSDLGRWNGTALVIPEVYMGLPVREISLYAIHPYNDIETVVLPSSLRFLSANAFRNAEKLQYQSYGGALYLGTAENPYFALIRAENKEITFCEFHEDTRIVADNAFAGCEKLTEVWFSDGILNLGKDVFYQCDAIDYHEYLGGSYLGSRENPYASLMRWQGTAEMACVLHSDTERIESGAFADTEVHKLTLNAGLRVIAQRAFSGVSGGFALTLPAGVRVEYQALSSAELGELYVPADAVLEPYAAAGGALVRAVFEEGREEIPLRCFEHCRRLTSVSLPEGLRVIGDNAFHDCGLLSVSLPSTLVSIGRYGFAGCYDLADLVLPRDLKKLGERAFFSCRSIRRIVIPESVSELGAMAFQSCLYLTEAVVESELSVLPMMTFQGCRSLRSVTLPATLKKIDQNAFDGCASLETLTIPDGVEEIEVCAFANCDSLRELSLPVSLTRMGAGVFLGCDALEVVRYPRSREDFFTIVKSVDQELVPKLVYGVLDDAETP